MPVIKGIVTESTDGTIVVDKVSFYNILYVYSQIIKSWVLPDLNTSQIECHLENL